MSIMHIDVYIRTYIHIYIHMWRTGRDSVYRYLLSRGEDYLRQKMEWSKVKCAHTACRGMCFGLGGCRRPMRAAEECLAEIYCWSKSIPDTQATADHQLTLWERNYNTQWQNLSRRHKQKELVLVCQSQKQSFFQNIHQIGVKCLPGQKQGKMVHIQQTRFCNKAHWPTLCHPISIAPVRYRSSFLDNLHAAEARSRGGSRAGLDFEPHVVHPWEPHGWRTVAKLAARPISKWGGVELGLYKLASHDVVGIPDCQVHHPSVNRAVSLVKESAKKVCSSTVTGRFVWRLACHVFDVLYWFCIGFGIASLFLFFALLYFFCFFWL